MLEGPRYLRPLALRKIRQMRPDDLSRPAVGMWLDILASADFLEQGTREERAAIWEGIRQAFQALEPDGGGGGGGGDAMDVTAG